MGQGVVVDHTTRSCMLTCMYILFPSLMIKSSISTGVRKQLPRCATFPPGTNFSCNVGAKLCAPGVSVLVAPPEPIRAVPGGAGRWSTGRRCTAGGPLVTPRPASILTLTPSASVSCPARRSQRETAGGRQSSFHDLIGPGGFCRWIAAARLPSWQ